MRIRRRSVITAGLGTIAVGALGVGLARTARSVDPIVVTGSFDSPARNGTPTRWLLAFPPGIDPGQPVHPAGGRVPVAIALHGRGGSERMPVDLGLDQALAEGVAAGTLSPFVIAAVAGGDTYWHRRRDGSDSGAMVVREFLPRLADSGLAAGPQHRVGLLGWSMGGFGALHLAQQLRRARCAAVAVASPALWLRPGDTPQGAFDDRADFQRNDVFAGRPALAGIAVRIDCGLADPFLTASRRFTAGLRPAPAGGFTPGGHDGDYWRSLAGAQVAFLAGQLTPAGTARPAGR